MGRAFKKEHRLRREGYRTPSPPLRHISPVSPDLSGGASSASTLDQKSQYHSNSTQEAVVDAILPGLAQHDRDHTYHVAAAASSNAPLQSAAHVVQQQQYKQQQQPPGAQLSPALQSPIEALASAAVSSLTASPVYVESAARPPSHCPPISPTTSAAFFHPSQQGTKHSYPHDAVSTYTERPAKRIRSEFFPSPHSRPATSHMPSSQLWSYSVEDMVESGTRLYQDASQFPGHSPYEDNNSKRFSDAQLLLFLRESGSSRAQSFDAQSLQQKRWSVSYPDILNPHATQSLQGADQHNYHNAVPYPEDQVFGGLRQPPVHSPNNEIAVEQQPDNQIEPPLNSAAQTHTPPEDTFNPAIPRNVPDGDNETEAKKPKKHQGWPKGKPRGPRTGQANTKKKKPVSKAKTAVSGAASVAIPEQLYSPQSLPTDTVDVIPAEHAAQVPEHEIIPSPQTSRTRRHSLSSLAVPEHGATETAHLPTYMLRAQSVPLDSNTSEIPPADEPHPINEQRSDGPSQLTVCAGCNSSSSVNLIEESQQWISCDGCKGWFHFACAGFKTEREVRDVDKFFCEACSPQHGKTTKVRKSGRAHTAVDYAGLNEGILKTSEDNPEHHYIASFKNGDIGFTKEMFARMPPEYITAAYLEKINGFREPVVIPAYLNCRAESLPNRQSHRGSTEEGPDDLPELDIEAYDLVRDDGQDKIDMVIPQGLTVRRVAELYGPAEKVDVIDVKSQEGEDKRWTMAKWADYYEQEGEKPVRNVISLEVSRSRLGRLIRRPKAVRDMDLQDYVWPEEDKANAPRVQFYCLMSVADCYTDFHIDFGGSSVYYHIIKGKKTFFFIPPTKQNLKKYEDWCLSPKQSQEFLGQQVKECYRVDLSAGDTMLIPSGWIHAVWTPEDSLVIGGNFLTRIHYGMQIKVLDIEKSTNVDRKFRYPFFQKVMWFAVLKYLDEDPLPATVVELFQAGGQFQRAVPIFCEPNHFGHNSLPGPENYNARYYPKAELDGLHDLANYIWRTVMVSLGRTEATASSRNAVTRSLPKGRGDPSTLARRFAMWVAWKRGNEHVLPWARAEAELPEAPDAKGEKKLSAAQVKRKERDTWSEAIRAVGEHRHSSRTRQEGMETPVRTSPSSTALLPAPPLSNDLTKHLSTPKTSQLGPKRVACDVCRKRRIRCKHKDDLVELSNGISLTSSPLGTTAASGSTAPGGLPIPPEPALGQRDIDADTIVIPFPTSSSLQDLSSLPNGADPGGEGHGNKSGRVKACADCRKSKRRCIHDENGNVDPVKASEAPIPRGSASKKRRVSEAEADSTSARLKLEQTPSNSHLTVMDSTSPQYAKTGESDIQMASLWASRVSDMEDSTIHVISPTKTREHSPSDDMMLVDNSAPSLCEDESNGSAMATVTLPARDTVMRSIEHHLEAEEQDISDVQIQEGDLGKPMPGPSSSGRPFHDNSVEAGAGRSSPLTDLGRTLSPDENRITVALPCTTPRNRSRSSRIPSSGDKSGQMPRSILRTSSTPKSGGAMGKGRRDSKSAVKLEHKARAFTTGETDEEASLRLALQLQQEEHGLRRRSK